MRTVTRYESEDGKIHSTERDCLLHEKRCADTNEANKMLRDGRPLLECLEHIQSMDAYKPDDRELLSQITKDTPIAIPHWQCRDQPGYKPVRIEVSGRLFVHGYTGAWSGAYGEAMWVHEYLTDVRQSIARGHKLSTPTPTPPPKDNNHGN